MGVPINEYGPCLLNTTPLGLLLYHSCQVYSPPIRVLVNSLVNMDATVDAQHCLIAVPVLGLQITELYEPLSCTELCYAVLHRNEHDVERLLSSGHSVLTERSTAETTMLHLSANWPRGLAILIEHAGKEIESIINITSNYYLAALEYAIMLENANSVELLLDAGARFTSYICEFLPHITNRRTTRIAYTIGKSLAQRRRDLLQLALLNLPSEKVTRLGLREEILLDDKAVDVVKALKQQGVLLPAIYDDIEPGSVYHWRELTPLIAQKLFDAGFHKTNAVYRGYHPLMVDRVSLHHNLDLISWFEDCGTDLYAPIPIPDEHFDTWVVDGRRPVYPAIHFCIAKLKLKGSNLDDLPKKKLSLFRRLLEDKMSDPCICYCTTKELGCTSTSKYARNLIGVTEFKALFYWFLKHLSIIERAMSESDDYPRVALGITRICTFGILGMRHTCCEYNRRFDPIHDAKDLLILMDPEEIEEIRGEDRFLAALLETLMIEFEKKFYELKLPLSQFMETYWWPRMQEVEREREEPSAEDLHAIMEIGVVLDDA
ncbi:hypothetical protein F4821DRAFT_183032 [Hypoxylon rubiginosum]|uniref:Uncharacterized protein n=1 Tax=Hypoxylon rubiginosum TaxID=110542 RepID=A0ACC0CTM1_9PEZI|nr:hypothetical protein F4821DRAFT_183032 [Hypoxylon rubiginosum]